MEALQVNLDVFNYFTQEQREYRELALYAVSKKGWLISDLNENFHHDKEIVIAALNNSPESFSYI